MPIGCSFRAQPICLIQQEEFLFLPGLDYLVDSFDEPQSQHKGGEETERSGACLLAEAVR